MNQKEVIELAKKWGFNAPVPRVLAFISELQKQMIAEGWRQCAKGQGETQFCAVAEQEQKKVAMLHSYIKKIVESDFELSEKGQMRLLEEGSMLLSATKQSTDAFIAGVRAEALEEATTAVEMIRYRRNNQGNTIGFNAIGDCIDHLHGMSAELRQSAAQPERKEGRTCSE